MPTEQTPPAPSERGCEGCAEGLPPCPVIAEDVGHDGLCPICDGEGHVSQALVEDYIASAADLARDDRCDCDQTHCPTDGVHAPGCASNRLPEEGVTAPDGSGWSR